MSEQASVTAATEFLDGLPSGLPQPEIITSKDGYITTLVWSAGRAARLELRFTGTSRIPVGKWQFGGLPDFPGGEFWINYPPPHDANDPNSRYPGLLAKIELVGLLQRLRDAK